jgi:C_GCAxxG_C_C family probable redox protein
MTPEDMRDRAIELFMQRFHCSQAVAAAGQEMMGIDAPAVIRAMGAFGGGVASQGSVCGCLTGGIAVISQLYSRTNPDEKESPEMWRSSYTLVKRFKELSEEYGSLNCCDIARVNWRDKDAVKSFYGNPESRRQLCAKLVGETAYALGELLTAKKKKE